MASDTSFNPGLGMQLRVMVTSFLVFGVIAGIIALIMWWTGIAGSGSILFWLAVSLAMVGVQWWLGPVIIKWATGAKELKRESAPEIYEIVERLARKANLPMPKLFVVNNPTPNAFAFGRTQKDSNIAVHSGILSVLNREELEGVLAHEMGHINNRDVAVMTLASVLPVLLYYGVLIFAPRDRNEGIGGSIGVFIGAIVAQFIGQLCVMWLSRQREYFADEFSAKLTGKPSSLRSALAKISYGAAAGKPAESGNMVRALYFAEPSGNKMNAAEIVGAIGSGNDAKLAEAIENEKKKGGWEFLMTHPLTAKRLERLMTIKKGITS